MSATFISKRPDGRAIFNAAAALAEGYYMKCPPVASGHCLFPAIGQSAGALFRAAFHPGVTNGEAAFA
ncbi:hypothetical protein, partial [Rhizobium leguminosarum]|uniref:hypothetical protein n=1 Tax=Rhizobium leguminosarum TaxID=384 RepID=UPI00197CF52F